MTEASENEKEKVERHVFELEKVNYFYLNWVARVNSTCHADGCVHVPLSLVDRGASYLCDTSDSSFGTLITQVHTQAPGTPDTLYKHFGCSVLFFYWR